MVQSELRLVSVGEAARRLRVPKEDIERLLMQSQLRCVAVAKRGPKGGYAGLSLKVVLDDVERLRSEATVPMRLREDSSG